MNIYLMYISCLIKNKLTNSDPKKCLYNTFSNNYKERNHKSTEKSSLGAIFK